ncbi:cytochrome P450 [Aspergillus aurantiobrunneus]
MLSSLSPTDILTQSIPAGLAGCLVYLLLAAVYNRYFHPLSHFPGPFWASITTLWYFKTIRLARAHDVQQALHTRYGDFVRIAPNHLAVCNPAAIETVFGTKSGRVWRKGGFYDGFDAHIPNARTDSFSERDEAKSAERRRLVGGLYAQGNVLRYEPCVDRLIDLFYQRMEHSADSRAAVDMSVALKRYTFDVIGEIFHGRRGGFGMLREWRDYNKWCYLMEVMPDIGASITYLPWGLRTLYLVTQLVFQSARDGIRGMRDIVVQAEKATMARWTAMQRGDDDLPEDILTGLLDIVRGKGNHQARWTIPDVVTEVWATIWAGSDTTASALTSIFYHLHKHPEKLGKLRRELDAAFDEGRLSYPVRFNEARKLPYLHAVVMESMRVHPSVGLGLPREVPAGGASICGTFVPGNVEVIMNPAAVHVDLRVFGADAAVWMPERWLGGAERTRELERSMLQFGHGPRMCMGRHISEIEMYKLLPTLLREFEFEMLVDRWEVWSGWFHRTSNVMCRVQRRRPGFTRPELVQDGSGLCIS